MGCLSSIPEPPAEATLDTRHKIKQLQSLWVPESIWTGTVKFRGGEEPWEIHVKRDSKPGSIKAKRVTNFAQSTFTDAKKCEFDFTWEQMLDDKGKHLGYKEIITFDWEDEQYRLFADTLDGILDVTERRIKGLVVNNTTRDTGSVDFCRVMAKKRYGDQEVIHTVSYDFGDNDKRAQRIKAAMKTVDSKFKQEHAQLTGGRRTGPPEEQFNHPNVLKGGGKRKSS